MGNKSQFHVLFLVEYNSADGECKTEISHAENLLDIFGTEIMQETDAEGDNH